MKHLLQIQSEFVKEAAWWSGMKFRHPESNNLVKFRSLPIEKQKRLNILHKEKSKKEDTKETVKGTEWWSGKKFRHPESDNLVDFESLPIEKQQRLDKSHKSKSL